MLNRRELQQAWDRTHQEKPSSELPEESVVTFAQHIQQLSPKGTLLDVGCGKGRHTLYLSQLGFTVYGCDLSPLALEIAAKRIQQAGASVNFQISDLTHLPYANNVFAAAICVHVLPYQLKIDIIKGIKELWRVLQPNGWLYFDLLDCDDAEYGLGRELEEHTFLESDGIPFHFSSRQEISELSKDFSLERAARFEQRNLFSKKRVGWVVWAVKCIEE